MSDITRDWSFGGQLRFYRIQEEISLRSMSAMIKSDPGNYSKMERGELPPPSSSAEIKRMIKPLKLSPPAEQILYVAAYNFHLGRLQERFWS